MVDEMLSARGIAVSHETVEFALDSAPVIRAFRKLGAQVHAYITLILAPLSGPFGEGLITRGE